MPTFFIIFSFIPHDCECKMTHLLVCWFYVLPFWNSFCTLVMSISAQLLHFLTPENVFLFIYLYWHFYFLHNFSYPIVLFFPFTTLSIFTTIVLIFFPLINPMPMFLQEQFSVIYFVPLNRPYFPIYLYTLHYFVDIAADFAKSRSWKFWKSSFLF